LSTPPREHRERRLDRLDEAGQLERELVAAADRVRESREARRGFGCDLGEALARVELVLRGEHHARVVAGQAELLGDHGGDQRAEVLVVAEYAVDPLVAKARHDVVHEAKHIEPAELQVLREAEQVEPGVDEFVAAGVLRAPELEPVPFLRKQDEDALHQIVPEGSIRLSRAVGCNTVPAAAIFRGLENLR
jgi:hypothetical protein